MEKVLGGQNRTRFSLEKEISGTIVVFPVNSHPFLPVWPTRYLCGTDAIFWGVARTLPHNDRKWTGDFTNTNEPRCREWDDVTRLFWQSCPVVCGVFCCFSALRNNTNDSSRLGNEWSQNTGSHPNQNIKIRTAGQVDLWMYTVLV